MERMSDKSRTAVRMMTGNAAYPPRTPRWPMWKRQPTRWTPPREAYAFNRGKLEKDARDTAFLALKELYSGLGAYVQTTSGGDKELIPSAGFDTRREPSPAGPAARPGNVRAEVSPYKGRLIARWDGVAGRSIYKLYTDHRRPHRGHGLGTAGRDGQDPLRGGRPGELQDLQLPRGGRGYRRQQRAQRPRQRHRRLMVAFPPTRPRDLPKRSVGFRGLGKA